MTTTNDMPPTVDLLLTTQQIPDLDSLQMSALLYYMFQRAPRPLRLSVAEVVYRQNRTHAKGLDVFLACVLPLAEKTAHRRAERLAGHSAWTFEVMYDGAVNAAIEMFQRGSFEVGIFRRYLLRALAQGTTRYFIRKENSAICSLPETLSARAIDGMKHVCSRRRLALNSVEEHMISKQLLDQVTGFQKLPDEARAVLRCIRTLGADVALKEHAFTKGGDPDKWKRALGGRPILDVDAIAEAMKTDRATVRYNLQQARVYLRKTFNADGRLFQRR